MALESEAFLLGIWKNYDELESNICIDELIATINAVREKEHREHRFFAAIQGIDIDENQREAEDITSLKGFLAHEAGFGINQGLGYMQVGE